MRIGVFGGTFDPVHYGHLILAEQSREQGELNQVWFIPAAHPPHKQEAPITPFARRVEMLALAIAGNPTFRIEEVEKELPPPSYTVRTLEELHRRHPNTEFWLLMGTDSLVDLPHWHEPGRVLELAGLLVVERPGSPTWSNEQLAQALPRLEGRALRSRLVQMPRLEIASRDLRRRAAEKRSLRYFLPRAVESYITTHELYRAPAGS